MEKDKGYSRHIARRRDCNVKTAKIHLKVRQLCSSQVGEIFKVFHLFLVFIICLFFIRARTFGSAIYSFGSASKSKRKEQKRCSHSLLNETCKLLLLLCVYIASKVWKRE